ncbi:hypothetical protein, variant 1 [Verruconis gallopava]|nr:hypothetical protein, variant 1 [Verruconis gallopava]KIV99953.1 hypothetical protein, variant 1 [Verruconis gallopava]
MKRKMLKLRKHHSQVRAYILAQAHCKASTGSVHTACAPEALSEQSTEQLLDKLRSPWNRMTPAHRGHVHSQVDDIFYRPQPVAQRRQMHPALRRVVEVTKALERYNEYARKQIMQLEEGRQALQASGRAAEEMPAASKKLKARQRRRSRSEQCARPGSPLASSSSEYRVEPLAPSPVDGIHCLPLPTPTQSYLSGESVVDRSRDPRLRGQRRGGREGLDVVNTKAQCAS